VQSVFRRLDSNQDDPRAKAWWAANYPTPDGGNNCYLSVGYWFYDTERATGLAGCLRRIGAFAGLERC
jgi:hypothetical protein